MTRITTILMGALTVIALLAVACDEGSDVRTLSISVGDAGCTPAEFQVTPGQRVRLLVENDSDVVFIISSEDGEFPELRVGGDEDGEAFYTVPTESGSHIFQCEAESGNTTNILLVARTEAELTPVTNPTPEPGTPDTLAVSLMDYTVSPSDTTLAPGSYNIIATNVSPTETHDLHVLSLQTDGSFSPIAAIPPIAPQQGGAVLVNLTPGTYRLACMIKIGQAGSTVDHYQQNMWIDVIVE